MKKIYFISTLVILVFTTNHALAISGDCSSHGGVNCSLETSTNHAVCNDGFTSSDYYSSVAECRITVCVPSVSSGCKTESDYSNLEIYWGNRGGFMNSQMDGALQVCRNQINEYQSSPANCYSNPGNPHIIPASTPIPTPIPTPTSCPINSNLDGNNNCICTTGYVADPTKTFCVVAPAPTPLSATDLKTENTICLAWHGNFTKYDESLGQCVCLDGYGMANDACALKPTPTTTPQNRLKVFSNLPTLISPTPRINKGFTNITTVVSPNPPITKSILLSPNVPTLKAFTNIVPTENPAPAQSLKVPWYKKILNFFSLRFGI